MFISHLLISHYRNVERIDFKPDQKFNVLWGENAQGKTNVLEAIYILGHLKSFRTAKNPELIRHGQDKASLLATVSNYQVNHKLEISVLEKARRAFVNGKEIERLSEFFGLLRPVLFSPEEVATVKGPPSARRSLLDRALFQTDMLYLERVRKFNRILKQRNRLLKENCSMNELLTWTEALITTGARIRNDRFIFLERIRKPFQEIYRNIAGGRETADLTYSEGGSDLNELQITLEREAEKARTRERQLGTSLFGPQRDDPDFSVNKKPLRLYGSQGQQRSFILAFKTAQILDLETLTGEPPILLLDDMTSELDRTRQDFFFRFLLEHRGQVFITTTEVQPLTAQGIRNAHLFKIEQGSLRQEILA